MLARQIDVPSRDPILLPAVGGRRAAVESVPVGTIFALPADAGARRDSCTISWALAEALGIAPGIGPDDQVQVRVEAPDHEVIVLPSALYAVVGTFWTFPAEREIRLYPDRGSEIGGARKLYAGPPPPTPRVRVRRAAVWPP